MQCNCGREMISHVVQRNNKIVGSFMACSSCGRVEKSKELKKYIIGNKHEFEES